MRTKLKELLDLFFTYLVVSLGLAFSFLLGANAGVYFIGYEDRVILLQGFIGFLVMVGLVLLFLSQLVIKVIEKFKRTDALSIAQEHSSSSNYDGGEK